MTDPADRDRPPAWGPPWRDRWHERGGGRGPWGPPGRGPWGPRRGFGCLFAVFFLVVGSAFVVVGSIVLSFVGLLGGGSAPGLPQLAAFVVLAAGVVAFVAIGRLFRATASTLDELVAAARRVEGGDYGVRVAVPSRGPRPLRDLVHGFNTMVERLEADERQRRSLLADVSHELRTPLSVVQGHLEAIADGVYPADDAHLGTILDETRVMARLVDDLRTVALSETGSLPLHPEPTDLGVLVGEVVSSFGAAAESAGLALVAEVDESVPLLEIDPVRTREVIANLVANALRYTPATGTIRITASAQDGHVRVAVADTGRGIPADVLPHVFDRFWKSADSRGSGLGLAIARNLVHAHGGEIGAESPAGGGTTIWFTLPAA